MSEAEKAAVMIDARRGASSSAASAVVMFGGAMVRIWDFLDGGGSSRAGSFPRLGGAKKMCLYESSFA